jgi:hypothetical protein
MNRYCSEGPKQSHLDQDGLVGGQQQVSSTQACLLLQVNQKHSPASVKCLAMSKLGDIVVTVVSWQHLSNMH